MTRRWIAAALALALGAAACGKYGPPERPGKAEPQASGVEQPAQSEPKASEAEEPEEEPTP